MAQAKRSIVDLALFGGTPVFGSPLHVGQLNLPNRRDFAELVDSIFESRWLSNDGPQVRAFEAELGKYVGTKHVISVANGTVGLMLAGRAVRDHLATRNRPKVLVPSFTFVATVQAFAWLDFEPVFCDVDPRSHVITPELAEPLMSQEIAAIVPVHLWGKPVDVEGFAELAKAYGSMLIYDSAHAIGASFEGRPIGNFGDLEVFSCHATKILSTGEGGFITTNNDKLAGVLRDYRNFAFRGVDHVAGIGMNAKLSELSAAFGRLSLNDLDTNIQANAKRFTAYVDGLAGVPGLTPVHYDSSTTPNYQYVVFDVDESIAGFSRDELANLLRGENILARCYFKPGVHRMEPFCNLSPDLDAQLPNTCMLSERLIQFPSGQAIENSDIEAVCAFIRWCVENARDIRASMLKAAVA